MRVVSQNISLMYLLMTSPFYASLVIMYGVATQTLHLSP
jgi:hypothetical protein